MISACRTGQMTFDVVKSYEIMRIMISYYPDTVYRRRYLYYSMYCRDPLPIARLMCLLELELSRWRDGSLYSADRLACSARRYLFSKLFFSCFLNWEDGNPFAIKNRVRISGRSHRLLIKLFSAEIICLPYFPSRFRQHIFPQRNQRCMKRSYYDWAQANRFR